MYNKNIMSNARKQKFNSVECVCSSVRPSFERHSLTASIRNEIKFTISHIIFTGFTAAQRRREYMKGKLTQYGTLVFAWLDTPHTLGTIILYVLLISPTVSCGNNTICLIWCRTLEARGCERQTDVHGSFLVRNATLKSNYRYFEILPQYSG